MTRLAALLCLTLGVCALAEPAKKKPRWKCTFRGRVVFCDLADRPLQLHTRDRISLFDRTAPTFGPLVTAPASLLDRRLE